jgi:hypothetical protein
MKVVNLEWNRSGDSDQKHAWCLKLSYSPAEDVLNILDERIHAAMRNTTIFPEKIPCVTGFTFGAQSTVDFWVSTREEAEKRRAAAQHETK